MKKLMVMLLIGCLVLLVSGSIFAATFNTNEGEVRFSDTKDAANVGASTSILAYVTPYASIHFNNDQTPKPLTFSGVPNEIKDGNITYSLETNCNVYVDGFGTAFKGTIDGVLKTWYQLVPADAGNGGSVWKEVVGDYVWAPEGFDHQYAPNYVGLYNVNFKAQTGPNISSQRAGNYAATYTVTVWHPYGLN